MVFLGVPSSRRVGVGSRARGRPQTWPKPTARGRWVIYEVLKSIFEAVIYLTALSLNKHRICLIIVTLETQHPNGLASAAASASPPPPQPGRPVSTQPHPSGAGAPSPAAGHPGLRLPGAPPLILPPGSLSFSRSPTRAHTPSPRKGFAKSILPGTCTCGTHPAAAGAREREAPWPLCSHLPRFPCSGGFLVTLIQPGSGDSRKVKGTFCGWPGQERQKGRVLGLRQQRKRTFFSFLGDFASFPSRREGKAPFA